MAKFKPVIITAAITAIILSAITYWVPHLGWQFFPYVLLAGMFLTWVQKESISYKFLDKLAAGSILFGILLAGLIYARMYALSRLVYGAPLPLNLLIDKDTLVLAGVYACLCFLGGLAGIVLKGLYALYRGKLDKVIVIIGPLLTALSSLAVFKIDISGTVMSGYYGLPYSYFTYQIKDVIDGNIMDKWIFSPGSIYHYVIFNYLLYFLIFISVYYLIKLYNRRYAPKILNRTYVLLGLLFLMILAFTSYLPVKLSYIEHRIAVAGDCRADADCTIIGNIYPFSCAVVTNRENAAMVSELVKSYPAIGQFNCSGRETAACIQGKCRVAVNNTADETYWQILKQAIGDCQVKSVMQTHALVVTAVLKNGKTIKAKEPAIDDIFGIVAASKDKCGDIIMATE